MTRLLPIFLLFGLVGCGSIKVSIQDQKNPTSYTFASSGNQIKEVFESMLKKDFSSNTVVQRKLLQIGPEWEAKFKETDDFKMVLLSHKSKFYKVNGGDSGYGHHGVLSGSYSIWLEEVNGKTKVTLGSPKLKIIVDSSKDVTHGVRVIDVPERKEVRTANYYEYEFLLELGKLLGEKGMPPIKTK